MFQRSFTQKIIRDYKYTAADTNYIEQSGQFVSNNFLLK